MYLASTESKEKNLNVVPNLLKLRISIEEKYIVSANNIKHSILLFILAG